MLTNQLKHLIHYFKDSLQTGAPYTRQEEPQGGRCYSILKKLSFNILSLKRKSYVEDQIEALNSIIGVFDVPVAIRALDFFLMVPTRFWCHLWDIYEDYQNKWQRFRCCLPTQIDEPSDVDIPIYVDWRGGNLRFMKQPRKQVLSTLDRYIDTVLMLDHCQIVTRDDGDHSIFFSLNIDTDERKRVVTHAFTNMGRPSSEEDIRTHLAVPSGRYRAVRSRLCLPKHQETSLHIIRQTHERVP